MNTILQEKKTRKITTATNSCQLCHDISSVALNSNTKHTTSGYHYGQIKEFLQQTCDYLSSLQISNSPDHPFSDTIHTISHYTNIQALKYEIN